MSKNDFNEKSGKTLNEYTLTLFQYAGMIPARDSKKEEREPIYQAELFRSNLGDWLEENHEYQNRNVLTTAVLPPSAEGKPRMKIVCTEATLEKIMTEFPKSVTRWETTAENVSSKRIIKRPGPGGRA